MVKPGPKPRKNVGRTAKFYRENSASRTKHSDDNNSGSGGKHAHSKEYKRKHYRERKNLGLKIGDTRDASKQPDGSYRAESSKQRGRKK